MEATLLDLVEGSTTVEQAWDVLSDDRSHGDDYVADAAGEAWRGWTGDPRDVAGYVRAVAERLDKR